MLVAGELVLQKIYQRPKLAAAKKNLWVQMPDRFWTEYHPLLGWYNQKNKAAVLELKSGKYAIQTNAMGFRGTREYDKKNNPNVIKIIVLGDSYAFGWGVQNDETFAVKLEHQYRNLEMINLGVVGYGIDQMYLCYKELGREFHADYVIISVFPEDFWRATRAFSETGHGKPYFTLSSEGVLKLNNVPVKGAEDLQYNQFPDLIEQNAFEKIMNHSVIYRLAKKVFIKYGKNLGAVDPNTTDEWRLGKAILHELIQEIRKSGAQPIIIIIPPVRWLHDSQIESIQKSLWHLRDQENVEIFDLTTYFQKSLGNKNLTDFYIQDDWHWTKNGHEVVAAVLNDYLSTQGKKLYSQTKTEIN